MNRIQDMLIVHLAMLENARVGKGPLATAHVAKRIAAVAACIERVASAQ